MSHEPFVVVVPRDTDGDVTVWLEVEAGGPRALCIGVGDTRAAALKDAEETVTIIAKQLDALTRTT